MSKQQSANDNTPMRLDKWLTRARFCKTRQQAHKIITGPGFRLNGRKIDKVHVRVSEGDVLVMFHLSELAEIHVTALPLRRGSADEAQSCYRRVKLEGVHNA